MADSLGEPVSRSRPQRIRALGYSCALARSYAAVSSLLPMSVRSTTTWAMLPLWTLTR